MAPAGGGPLPGALRRPLEAAFRDGEARPVAAWGVRKPAAGARKGSLPGLPFGGGEAASGGAAGGALPPRVLCVTAKRRRAGERDGRGGGGGENPAARR